MMAAQEDTPATGAPQLSVILATDTWATIRPVVGCLLAQTIRERIEIVFVSPAVDALRAEMDPLPEFAAVRFVAVGSLVPLGSARAAGVGAVTAALVFMGETHTYAHPGWAAALVAAADESRAVVVPAFGNANPSGALSWAGFLSDYGPWTEGGAPGEIDFFPINNAAYRLAFLCEFGDDLAHALSHGDRIVVGLRARGYRAWFEPSARIDHLNVARTGAWIDERFVAGAVIGWNRGAQWSLARRALYVCASPLIPFVLLARTISGVRAAAQRRRLPRGTLPAMVLGAFVKAAGEAIGYARLGNGGAAEVRMTEYEVHKVGYAQPAS